MMTHQMKRLFGDVFGRPFAGLELAAPRLEDLKRPWAPTMDVVETPDHLAVRVEVAGVDIGDIDVSVENGVLTVSGEKQERSEHTEGDWHRVESRFGAFRRSLRLPERLDTAHITADYDNGVLVVKLPKLQAPSPTKIAVTKK